MFEVVASSFVVSACAKNVFFYDSQVKFVLPLIYRMNPDFPNHVPLKAPGMVGIEGSSGAVCFRVLRQRGIGSLEHFSVH
jgi:hypothetical protein